MAGDCGGVALSESLEVVRQWKPDEEDARGTTLRGLERVPFDSLDFSKRFRSWEPEQRRQKTGDKLCGEDASKNLDSTEDEVRGQTDGANGFEEDELTIGEYELPIEEYELPIEEHELPTFVDDTVLQPAQDKVHGQTDGTNGFEEHQLPTTMVLDDTVLQPARVDEIDAFGFEVTTQDDREYFQELLDSL